MEITPILANSNPSIFLLMMMHGDRVPSFILWWVMKGKPLISLNDLLFKLWLQFFTLGFWLKRLFRVTCCQRNSRNLIVCWSSYLKVLILLGGLPLMVLWIENRHRVSPLKQSASRRSTLFSISFNMLLQFSLPPYDRFVRRACCRWSFYTLP